jgi:hypothetical protein
MKLESVFAQHAEDKVCLVKMGGTEDNLSNLSWTPADLKLKNTQLRPECLESFGGPWLYANHEFAARDGVMGQVFRGMAHFLITKSGSFMIFLYKIAALLKLGQAPVDGLQFLGKMDRKESIDWCDKNVIIGTFCEKQVLWVPGGYQWVLVGLPSAEARPNYCVHQPFFNTSLAQAMDKKVMDAIAKMHLEFLRNHNGKGPYKSIATQYLAWLKLVAPNSLKDSKEDKKDSKKVKKDKKEGKAKSQAAGAKSASGSAKSARTA